MAEILVKYDEPINSARGDRYFAQAVGQEVAGAQWEGWLEFVSATDAVETVASGRETTQPNRMNIEYWAQGLTKVYLEGALARAISLASPLVQQTDSPSEAPHLSEPPRRNASSPQQREVAPRAILDPFQVYSQGEDILRRELNALSRDHVESIATAYRVGKLDGASAKSGVTRELIESIVADVRNAVRAPSPESSGEIRRSL